MADNPALSAATEYAEVLPIYILDDVNAGDRGMGAASRVWLHHSLAALNKSLNGRLVLFRGNAREIIESLVTDLPVNSVSWNRCYELWEASTEILRAAGIILGVDYPEPILDLKVTRERVLARYKALR